MLIQRVIGLPMSVISGSISDVFQQKASYEYAKYGNCNDTFVSTFKKLLFISIVPFAIFYYIAPDLFAFVFSEKWRIAGVYAQILTPMFVLQFITSPLSNMFIVAEKQKIDLYLQVFLFVLILLSFYIGKYIFDDIKITLILFSLAYFIGYIIGVFMTYNFSKGVANKI
jgi:O-antigen/teichoic acid export membrane protein